MNGPRLRLATSDDGERKREMLEMLDRIRGQVEDGTITRLGIVSERGSDWASEFSRTPDRRLDAAMLFELGMRRLGFEKDGRSYPEE